MDRVFKGVPSVQLHLRVCMMCACVSECVRGRVWVWCCFVLLLCVLFVVLCFNCLSSALLSPACLFQVAPFLITSRPFVLLAAPLPLPLGPHTLQSGIDTRVRRCFLAAHSCGVVSS